MQATHRIHVQLQGGLATGFICDAGEEPLVDFLSENTDFAVQAADLLSAGGYRVSVLQSINVEPAQRGRGIGDRLVNQFLEDAEKLGSTVTLFLPLESAGDFDLTAWLESFGFGGVKSTEHGMLMAYPYQVAKDLEEECGA